MRQSNEVQISTLGWLLHGAGIVVLCLLVVGYVFVAGMPLKASKDICEQRVAQLNLMLSKAPRVRAEHKDYQMELASLKQSVEETQRRLPRELNEDQFLEEVRAAAQRTNVSVGDYQLGAIEQLESYSKADVTLQCRGSFASICRFLNEIDHFARITEVSNLQIEAAENLVHYPLQVTFVLYFGGSNHDRSRQGEVL